MPTPEIAVATDPRSLPSTMTLYELWKGQIINIDIYAVRGDGEPAKRYCGEDWGRNAIVESMNYGLLLVGGLAMIAHVKE